MSSLPLSTNDFVNTRIVTRHHKCTFKDEDIQNIKKYFPEGTVFRPFDPKIKCDAKSKTWICFPEFPFKNLHLSFPFPPFYQEFFRTTGLSYGQAMPMVWRVLFALNGMIERKIDLRLPDLKYNYSLQTFGSGYFMLKSKTKKHRVFTEVTQNDPPWKDRFFFVLRESLPQESFLLPCWNEKGRNIYFLCLRLQYLLYIDFIIFLQ